MSEAFAGKSVIVTGGASGIGEAVATRLACEGARVILADSDTERGHALSDRLGGSTLFIETDVSVETAVKRMIEEAVSMNGRLDGAINCAGLPPRNTKLHEMGADQFSKCLSVNLIGQFYCMKHQIGAMLSSGSGAIVAFSSTAAISAVPGSADYCAAKAGVEGLVRAAALDYASHGIRVNGVMPGPVMTPMFVGANRDNPDFQKSVNAVPMRRVAEPREAADVALWLLSDRASYMTGAIIPVDGGLTIC